MNKKVLFICQAAIIAALYVVFGFVSGALGLSSGAIQVRISDALCVLVAFTPAAIPGVTLGCLLYNFLSGCILIDVCLGTLATLIGCLLGWVIVKALKEKIKVLAVAVPIPYVLANALIVPYVLTFYGVDSAYWINFLTVGLGEVIACVVLGLALFYAVYPVRHRIFGTEK
ncbi:MAG: QueT transporter family protein [Lachnospiraceae bacterium]|nr:QueT transporter family protein [Lachnospiraceae bacterium]